MRARSILLAAGVLTMWLTPIGSGQASASAQIYDWTTIAGLATNSGSADGTNNTARFYYPYGVAVDTNGNLYVADTSNRTIRKVTPVGTNWVTSTIAGTVTNSGSADGTNNNARFYYPFGIAVDTNGNVYVADTFNHTIRKLVPVGTNWVTTTIAGSVGNSGSDDGTNSDARFNWPVGVAVGTNGNVYVADRFNYTIRKLVPVGTNWAVRTIAGQAETHGSADGTNNTAQFYEPLGIAADTNGNLYVADYANETIRKIMPVGTNWVVSTIAGLAGNSGSTDGTNGSAQFSLPFGIAVDTNGKLYVADYGNVTVRKVMPVGTNWVVSTIGGLAGYSGSTDGTNSVARFDSPTGVAVDADGSLYIMDEGNHTIRRGVPLSTPTITNTLTITKETAKLNFAKTNACSCALTATLDLGAGYDLTNLLVSLDIGGADASFRLDAKGKGSGVGTNGTSGTCKLSYKSKTASWTFTAALKNGSWATPWGTYGLTNYSTTAKAGDHVTLPVTLVIGDELFYGEKALLYKAKAGKSGSAK